ncbi:zeta toxin family protein [Mannheimia sp. HC-2023]|uniref:zeta toxin family protein n=1 Tax=Mannheimia indoligenes TaxID=3103145 RepID=UPI002FE54403
MLNNLAIFYCGTNGAGKSTLRSFNQDKVEIVIDSDNIAMQINPTNPRLADIEAGRKAIELFQFAVKNQIAFSMESTLSGKSILKRMENSKARNFRTRLNYIGVDDPDINIERVKARVKAGGHFIDEETIRKRYHISRENLINAIFINDETLIYDNSETKPNLIFQIADKKIIKIADKIPNWCNQLCDELVELGFKTT